MYSVESKRLTERKNVVYFKINAGGPRAEKRIKFYLRQWKTECEWDGLKPNIREASQRHDLIKGLMETMSRITEISELIMNSIHLNSELMTI